MVELFKKYPKSAKLIKEYFNKAFLESLNSAEHIDQEFLEQVKNESYQPFTEESLAKMLDKNPGSLFCLFDENEILINIYGYHDPIEFDYSINLLWVENIDVNIKFPTRKEAEKEAVKEAMKLLEEKL